MPKAPAFQFYPKDFLSDEDQAVMSCEQAGAYIRLICHAWNEGSIPDDAVKCARLAGSDPKRFSAHVWPSVRLCFRPVPIFVDDPEFGSRLIHPRLEKEREKQLEFSGRQRVKGLAGAIARHGRGHAPATAQAQPNGGSSVFSLQTAVSTPPNPPHGGGRRLTRKERENAADSYRVALGSRCIHEPKCASSAECIELIGLHQRTRRTAVSA